MGVELAESAQYNPQACAELWERIADKKAKRRKRKAPKNVVGAILGTVGEVLETTLSTHPPSAHRCSRIEDYLSKLKKKKRVDRYYDGVTNFKKRKAAPRHQY